MFITFEGIDFCGKSTQINLLKEYFEKKGKTVRLIREPGGTAISEKVRDILLDKKNSAMVIETEILLFSAARAQLVREKVLPALSAGEYVLSDRFYDSTTAYQGFGRGIETDFVQRLNLFAVGAAVPELTFLLDIPVIKAMERKTRMKDEPDRIERSDSDFFDRVREGYRVLAASHSRFCLLDALEPIEILHQKIISRIESYAG